MVIDRDLVRHGLKHCGIAILDNDLRLLKTFFVLLVILKNNCKVKNTY